MGGTDRNLGGYSRYLMPGQRQDICDLSIDPVLPIDEGLYQCQVSGGHGVPPIASSPVSLSVNSEPGKPYIMPRKGNVSSALYMAWLDIMTENLPPTLLIRYVIMCEGVELIMCFVSGGIRQVFLHSTARQLQAWYQCN